jgi:hypothetical protein
VPEFLHKIHLILKRTPTLFEVEGYTPNSLSKAFGWKLSEDSTDWYTWNWDYENRRSSPPFYLQIIPAGSRCGWSWHNGGRHSCEINWLDLEPDSESSDYEACMEELQRIEERVDFYRTYRQPPNEEEYRRLCEGLREQI